LKDVENDALLMCGRSWTTRSSDELSDETDATDDSVVPQASTTSSAGSMRATAPSWCAATTSECAPDPLTVGTQLGVGYHLGDAGQVVADIVIMMP
jgi:hypothetical protein